MSFWLVYYRPVSAQVLLPANTSQDGNQMGNACEETHINMEQLTEEICFIRSVGTCQVKCTFKVLIGF